MRVDVDEARNDQLATRIDGFSRVGCYIGIDRDDATLRNGYVANAVQSDRRVDYPAASDDEVVARGLRPERPRDVDEARRGGGRRKKLAAVHVIPTGEMFGALSAPVKRQFTVCQSEIEMSPENEEEEARVMAPSVDDLRGFEKAGLNQYIHSIRRYVNS
jgi:hypothetical protein